MTPPEHQEATVVSLCSFRKERAAIPRSEGATRISATSGGVTVRLPPVEVDATCYHQLCVQAEHLQMTLPQYVRWVLQEQAT